MLTKYFGNAPVCTAKAFVRLDPPRRSEDTAAKIVCSFLSWVSSAMIPNASITGIPARTKEDIWRAKIMTSSRLIFFVVSSIFPSRFRRLRHPMGVLAGDGDDDFFAGAGAGAAAGVGVVASITLRVRRPGSRRSDDRRPRFVGAGGASRVVGDIPEAEGVAAPAVDWGAVGRSPR